MNNEELLEAICAIFTQIKLPVQQEAFAHIEIKRESLTTTPKTIRLDHAPDWIVIDTTGSSDSVRVGFGSAIDESNYYLIAANRNRDLHIQYKEFTCRADSGTATICIMGLRYK